jgi:RNA polymerase sigma-B factor
MRAEAATIESTPALLPEAKEDSALPRHAVVQTLSEVRLFKRCRQGDAEAREELITRHMPVARRLAGRYRHTNEPHEDLEQVAYTALVAAIDRYNPAIGPFVPFAVPSILGELKRHFRDRVWMVHLPRSLKERHLRVNEVIERLSSQTGRTPNPREIAEATGLDLDEVLEALEAAEAYSATTLDAPHPAAVDDSDRTLGDTIGAEDDRFELVELGNSVAAVFDELPEREQQILRLRFVDDLTQAEIATRMGISQMHVSRLIRRSLAQMRAGAEGEGDD